MVFLRNEVVRNWAVNCLLRRCVVSLVAGMSLGVLFAQCAGVDGAVPWPLFFALAALCCAVISDCVLLYPHVTTVCFDGPEEELKPLLDAVCARPVSGLVYHDFLHYLEARDSAGKKIIFPCPVPRQAAYLLAHFTESPPSPETPQGRGFSIFSLWRELTAPAVVLLSGAAVAGFLFPRLGAENAARLVAPAIVVLYFCRGMLSRPFTAVWRFEIRGGELVSVSLLGRRRRALASLDGIDYEVRHGPLFGRVGYGVLPKMRNPVFHGPASSAWMLCAPHCIINYFQENQGNGESVPGENPEPSRTGVPEKDDGTVNHLYKPSLLHRVMAVLLSLPVFMLAVFLLGFAPFSGYISVSLIFLTMGVSALAVCCFALDWGFRGRRHAFEITETGLCHPFRRGKPVLSFRDIRSIEHQPLFRRIRIAGGQGQPVFYLRSAFPDSYAAFQAIIGRIPLDTEVPLTAMPKRLWPGKVASVLVIAWFFGIVGKYLAIVLEGDSFRYATAALAAGFVFMVMRIMATPKNKLQTLTVRNGMLVLNYHGAVEQQVSLNSVTDVVFEADLNCDSPYMQLLVGFEDGTVFSVQPQRQDRYGLYLHLRRELRAWRERRDALTEARE